MVTMMSALFHGVFILYKVRHSVDLLIQATHELVRPDAHRHAEAPQFDRVDPPLAALALADP